MKRKSDALAKTAAMMWGELEKLPRGARLSLTAMQDDDPNNSSRTLFVFTARYGGHEESMATTLTVLSEEAETGRATEDARFRAAVNMVKRKANLR